MSESTETQKSYRCRHILIAGRRCRTAALRNENFCYYHQTTRDPTPEHRGCHPIDTEFLLPSLEDRASIQHALSQVLNRVATNQLDEKRARLLLYGLQIAASLLKKGPRTQQPRRYETHAEEPEPAVEDLTHDPTLGPLAPIAEITPPEDRGKGFAQRLLEELRSRQTEVEQPEEIPEAEPEGPTETIPTLQAVAEIDQDTGCPIHRSLTAMSGFPPKHSTLTSRPLTAESRPPTLKTQPPNPLVYTIDNLPNMHTMSILH